MVRIARTYEQNGKKMVVLEENGQQLAVSELQAIDAIAKKWFTIEGYKVENNRLVPDVAPNFINKSEVKTESAQKPYIETEERKADESFVDFTVKTLDGVRDAEYAKKLAGFISNDPEVLNGEEIWKAANNLRGSVKASDYREVINYTIFYKYLCENEKKFLRDEIRVEEKEYEAFFLDQTAIKALQDGIGYYIEPKYMFDNLISSSATKADIISAFSNVSNKCAESYKHIFTDSSSGTAKDLFEYMINLLSYLEAPEIKKILGTIGNIRIDVDKNYNSFKDLDLFGSVYEFFASKFAMSDKENGQYLTPYAVSKLIAAIASDRLSQNGITNNIILYDPACGSGSLLHKIGEAVKINGVSGDSIKYLGQDIQQVMVNDTKMSLMLRGETVRNCEIHRGDTLLNDWPFGESNVSVAVANPPYSLKWDPDTVIDDNRFKYGIAPKSKADLAFLQHCLYHIKQDGIAGIVLPHGVLFRGGSEETIRKALVQNRNIEAIIGLPSNLFYSTGIPTIIMILSKDRKHNTDGILFVDASNEFTKEKKQNELKQENILKIFNAVIRRAEIKGFSHIASYEEIAKNDYNLNIPRYVDTSDEEKEIRLDEIGSFKKLNAEIDDSYKKLRDMLSDMTSDDEDALKQLKWLIDDLT